MKTNQQAFLEIILDSITEGVFTVNLDYEITSFNSAAERITGTLRKEAIGKKCHDVFRADVCETECVLRKTLATQKPCYKKTVHIINSTGDKKTISISTAILKTPRGTITGGVETFRDLTAIEELRREILDRHTFADIVTKDHAMLRLFDMLPAVAASPSSVLITGESGTGKELLARAIHDLSARRDDPFITVNCGALPDTLLEAELFGHKKGAFTDAKIDKPGRFKRADGGTLFLDEIGEISGAMQVKLLRVLQEGVYEPLGATAFEKSDVRIIAATNQELHTLLEKKIFRKDFYYRINTVEMELPPLRDRCGDIPLLIEHFIRHFNPLYRKDISGITDTALSMLYEYTFEGNIRELRNIIEHAFILCNGNTIDSKHLPKQVGIQSKSACFDENRDFSLQEVDRQMIISVLRKNHFNKKKSAEELNINPSTLWRKIKRYDISNDA